MLSQHLTIDILNHAGGDLYARTGEGESRAVLFGITSGGDKGLDTVYININNPVVTVRIVKPDTTFTITTAEMISEPGEIQEFRFFIPEAATQVSGIGSYDIRIQEDGEENIVYSAQGRFICDDNMLTDEMIESVAEVDGLIFPDDFLTTESGAATIDDMETALDTTWSSQKIHDDITAYAGALEDEIEDIIDDMVTSPDSTWSSNKIAEEIGSIEVLDVYSTTEKVVGEWTDGATLYERTFFKSNISGAGTIETGISFGVAFITSGYIALNDGHSILDLNEFLDVSLFARTHVEKYGDITYRLAGYTGDMCVTIRYTKAS